MKNKIIKDIQLDFGDVLIVPKTSEVNSRKDVQIERIYRAKYGTVLNGCGVIAANMATTGTFEMAQVLQTHQMFCALHKHYSAAEIIRFLENNLQKFGTNEYVFVSTGLRENDFQKLKQIMDTKLCHNICLDAPNGYIPNFVNQVKRLRMAFPDALIMAGNVVTAEKTAEIIQSGADVCKIGIGSGAVCTTRKQTGVGRPQLSAILECTQAAKENGGMICSDGGITCAGDVAKAFGAGADFTMIGGYFAGTDETAGEIYTKEGVKYKIFYGMSSKYAQDKFYGGMNDYRASEGKVVSIKYKGAMKDTLQELEGGLKSACSYVGARNIEEFPKKVSFYRVNHQLNEIFNGREKD